MSVGVAEEYSTRTFGAGFRSARAKSNEKIPLDF